MLNVGNQRREVQGLRHGGISMLSMYNEPPLVEVSLEEFEEFAIDRLHGTQRTCSFQRERGQRIARTSAL